VEKQNGYHQTVVGSVSRDSHKKEEKQALLLPVSELAESTVSMFSMQSNTILLEEMSEEAL
jgi:hypothetical protein